jgi:hypothetical protein
MNRSCCESGDADLAHVVRGKREVKRRATDSRPGRNGPALGPDIRSQSGPCSCESLLSRVTSDHCHMTRAGASAYLALPSRDSPDEPFPGYAAGILVDRPCRPDSNAGSEVRAGPSGSIDPTFLSPPNSGESSRLPAP